MGSIRIKRIYEPAEAKDGFRILIDRLWPRGIKKENAPIDRWVKSAAPSTELRKWFAHDPAKWETFQKKYKEELKKTGALDELIAYTQKYKKVTLLYAAKDKQHNQAIVLQELLQ
ncbi:MAG TPA: DUF488 domain-containing protein [Chitinophagaceae bacterium]|nr:DUF488 domain-containing protein [Chitinophagaceae bacterium]